MKLSIPSPGARSAAVALAIVGALCLGLACGPSGPERSLECAAMTQVTRVEDVHYEGVACDSAIAGAESRLTTAYYRKACEQLAPRDGVPPRVLDAYVVRCSPADEGGSMLTIDLCCPPPKLRDQPTSSGTSE